MVYLANDVWCSGRGALDTFFMDGQRNIMLELTRRKNTRLHVRVECADVPERSSSVPWKTGTEYRSMSVISRFVSSLSLQYSMK